MKLRRRYANMLIIVLYLLSQTLPIIPSIIFAKKGYNQNEVFALVVPYMVACFVIAAIAVYFVNRSIINETKLEQSRKENMVYTALWIFAGFIMSLFVQMILNMVNVYIFKQPAESQNTMDIMNVAKEFPLFILLVAIAGPILEEFVFRKVIFGELYNLFPFPRWASFIVAGLISGFIFSAAHNDFDHTLIYMGMAFVFAGLYVATRRILVPIIAHMLMNSFVVMIQLFFGEQIQKAAEDAKITTQFVWSFVKLLI